MLFGAPVIYVSENVLEAKFWNYTAGPQNPNAQLWVTRHQLPDKVEGIKLYMVRIAAAPPS